MRPFVFLLCILVLAACKSSKSTKVLKPKTHKMWAKGNKYLIDIPIGARHIRLFERKRTKTAHMN